MLGKDLKGYQVELRSIQPSDLEQLRLWRNSPEVSQNMLSQETITPAQQLKWFEKISHDNTQQHFAITYKGELLGAANLKSLSGDNIQVSNELEPGIYIGHETYKGNLLAFAPSLLLIDYCFYHLKVTKLRAVVKRENQAALKYNETLGYQVAEQDELIQIELTQENYEKSTIQLKKLLSRN